MLYQFQVYSNVILLYEYKYLFFFKFFSHLGHCRILQCAPQQVLVAYLFYIQQCVHMSLFWFDLLIPVAQLVKNPPAMQETWVRSLGWEDPLEQGKATHYSILAWRIPWAVQPMGSQSQTRQSDFHLIPRSQPCHQDSIALEEMGGCISGEDEICLRVEMESFVLQLA